ncbi:MAG: YggS family pyridoxal phosphate-dependent enzyme [Candidatus Delongbacteria bacterium]
MVKNNLENIFLRIKKICDKISKDSKEVILVAVSKTFPVSANYDCLANGHAIFGENKIQDLVRKRSYMYLDGVKEAKWHMIGHLQSNKAKQVVLNADMFQCLDSVKLAAKLNKVCKKEAKDLDVLIQINSSGEETKYGIKPAELEDFMQILKEYDRLKIRGLMSIGEYNEDPEDSRPEFKMMRDLFDRAAKYNGGNIDIKYLSMGMSHDFEIAVEEGANIIRVGTAIFGAREK